METMPLEDHFGDVIGKAQRGLGLSDAGLAARAGISREGLAQVKDGDFDAEVLRRVAPVLNLSAGKLVALAGYQPVAISVPGLVTFSNHFGSGWVNAYVVWTGNEALAFDTGLDARAMIAWLKERRLSLRGIFITHTHGDHVGDLERLHDATKAPAWVCEREATLDGACEFQPGHVFEYGPLRVEARSTSGHTRGGVSYVVTGAEGASALGRPLAIVGDALFAGSMGGGLISYADALQTNREEILSLPPETVICPGHGPLTTVEEELENNPFF